MHRVRREYYKLVKRANNRWHLLFVNGTLLAIGFYFVLQRLSGLSVSESLAHVFSENAAIVVKTGAVFAVAYCCIIKLGLLVFEAIPPTSTKSVEPESLNECVVRINDEIKRHLNHVYSEPELAAKAFTHAHQFDVNVALIVSALADHLADSFTGIKVRPRDIFISVYKIDGFEATEWEPVRLDYVTHFDHTKDLICSRSILISDGAYKDYECIKAINNKVQTVVLYRCDEYAKSRNNRHKTIKHYVGFSFEIEGKVIGFLNIEFHRHVYFPDSEKMLEFVERDILAFRCLIEYQFLKKKFLTAVKERLIAGRS